MPVLFCKQVLETCCRKMDGKVGACLDQMVHEANRHQFGSNDMYAGYGAFLNGFRTSVGVGMVCVHEIKFFDLYTCRFCFANMSNHTHESTWSRFYYVQNVQSLPMGPLGSILAMYSCVFRAFAGDRIQSFQVRLCVLTCVLTVFTAKHQV